MSFTAGPRSARALLPGVLLVVVFLVLYFGWSSPDFDTQQPQQEHGAKLVSTGHVSILPSRQRRPSRYSYSFSNIAIAVKSGSEVALERLPLLIQTYLQHVPNVMVFGDKPMRVGDMTMVDVVTMDHDVLDDKLGMEQVRKEEEENFQKETAKQSRKRAKEAAKQQKRKEDAARRKEAENKYKANNAPTVNVDDLNRRSLTDEDGSHILGKRQSESVKHSGDQVRPNHKAHGWTSDATKNLAGFKTLHQRFPHASWYIMIDDDTYLLLENVMDMLSKYDPYEDHYFGDGHLQLGCDNVRDWKDSVTFAQGGAGIVLSRGVMDKMQHNWDACMVKYRSCWAGDVRVSLCMRDNGIHLSDHNPRAKFNEFPPREATNVGSPKDPCNRPATFHHMLSHHIQELYELEDKVAGARVTNADLLDMDIGRRREELNDLKQLKQDNPQAYGIQIAQHKGDPVYHALHNMDTVSGGNNSSTYESDVNRPGSDYKRKTLDSAKLCMQLCLHEYSRCRAWTYEKGVCWLKEGVPAPDEKKNVISGAIRGRYSCDRD